MASGTTQAEFTQEVEERLEKLRKRFQELELEQMKKGEISARAKLDEAKKSVGQKRREAESQLRRARKASSNAWDDVREGLDSAWKELEDAVERAGKNFDGILEEDEDSSEEE